MPRLITLADLASLTPSEVFSVVTPGGIEHFGVLTGRHLFGMAPTIISASKIYRAVAEESLEQFSLGAPIYAHGVWSKQPWQRTVKNARSKIGTPYHLFQNNCEHFVRFCHGLPPESPQVAKAVGWTLVAGVAAWLLAA
jgi:hypothetical protein